MRRNKYEFGASLRSLAAADLRQKTLRGQLKYVWDNHMVPHASVHLVLCGSISSFLVNKVVRSKALYGRIDEVIDLGPLPLSDAYAGFFPRRSVREALEFYLVFGGVPRYLEMHDERRSTRLDIQELCFRPGLTFRTSQPGFQRICRDTGQAR